MKIGFIGLGIMGKPMCKNLLKAGYDIKISSRNSETNKELNELGAEVVSSLKQLAEISDTIITMLPNSPEVLDVILGKEGIINWVRRGTTIIDMSSISPIVSKEIYSVLIKKDIDFLDAPVSGGEPKAIDGTLSVMVGGKEEIFHKCLPILETMTSSVVRMGKVGSGNATKLVNQIIVALNIAAVSEAFVLAQSMKIDTELVYRAIRGGLAGSAVLDSKAPMIMNRDFRAGFKINLHLKDLNNVMDTSENLNTPLPLTSSIREILKSLVIDGDGYEDHAAIVKYFEKVASTEVNPKLVK
ncbi:2-hydroxy-3-oxopropionate reductase [Halalkalibacter oceani]|nr:2-hydroxy-3-oxopropionate reductase [Halalkalibacter oceani]